MNEQFLEGRGVVVFGGSSGIGRKIAAECVRAGATVWVGTTREENFQTTMQFMVRREKLDTSNLPIFPLIADVRDKRQLKEAVTAVKRKSFEVTDVVSSQAAGIDPFIKTLRNKYLDPLIPYTLSTPIDELSEEKRSIVEDMLARMREDLLVWNEQALINAVAVNYQGTFDAIDVLRDAFPHGFKEVFLNSTWGDQAGLPGVQVPLLYEVVEKSKTRAKNRFHEEGPMLAEVGVPVGIVIASLVSDTNVGKLFNTFFLNLMDKDQREAVRDSSIETVDVWRATQVLMGSNPVEWPSYPYSLYVYRKNGLVVVEKSLELSAMYTAPYRF